MAKPCAWCGAPERQEGTRLCVDCNKVIAAVPVQRRQSPLTGEPSRRTDYVSQGTGRENLGDVSPKRL